MRRNMFTGIGLAAVTLIVSSGLVACSDDDNVLPATDLNGDWTFTWTVTVATGVCAPELGEVTSAVITVTEELPAEPGSEVTFSGFEGEPGNILTGEYEGNDELFVDGSYVEGVGVTDASYIMDIVTANQMEGTETWTFTGPGGDCVNSQSSVVATRN